MKINSDGRIEYYRNCTPNGRTEVVDRTPDPNVVAPLLATNVKAGVFVTFERDDGIDKPAVIAFTKSSAAAKKIATFFGFSL